ncbi:MAG: hypothetical protein H6R13_3026 [Proteobacteria bacterium]|nr:hypothetical protein [Pseudomonadota bacterium]
MNPLIPLRVALGAFVLLVSTPLVHAQGNPLKASCISVVGIADQGTTAMDYTNNCDTCASFIPYIRNSSGKVATGLSAQVGQLYDGRLRLGPNYSDRVNFGIKEGSWSGYAQDVRECP